MPAQQGSPGPPHFWHRFAVGEQTDPPEQLGVGRLGGQQTSPGPPHEPQRPDLQVCPAS
jgi:hypothetical protein